MHIPKPLQNQQNWTLYFPVQPSLQPERTLNIIQALRQERIHQNRPTPEEKDELEEKKKDGQLVCVDCATPITRDHYRISKEGQHKHVFFNPHGLVFEIGCFASASSCTRVGQASFEFTWFAGYAWQILLCSACTLHLGWHFQSKAGDGFYGFILSTLREQPI